MSGQVTEEQAFNHPSPSQAFNHPSPSQAFNHPSSSTGWKGQVGCGRAMQIPYVLMMHCTAPHLL